MSFYIVSILLLLLIPAVIAFSFVAARISKKRRGQGGARTPRKFEPVTLDRSPEMPHRTDATS